jgi:hypothetical protein
MSYYGPSTESIADVEQQTIDMLIEKFGITAEQARAAMALVESRNPDSIQRVKDGELSMADAQSLWAQDFAALEHICAIFASSSH